MKMVTLIYCAYPYDHWLVNTAFSSAAAILYTNAAAAAAAGVFGVSRINSEAETYSLRHY